MTCLTCPFLSVLAGRPYCRKSKSIIAAGLSRHRRRSATEETYCRTYHRRWGGIFPLRLLTMEAAKSDYPFLTLWLAQFEKMVRKYGLGSSRTLVDPDEFVDEDHSVSQEDMDRYFEYFKAVTTVEKMETIVVKRQIEYTALPRFFPMTKGPSAPRSGI
jgi:hypothetical protein